MLDLDSQRPGDRRPPEVGFDQDHAFPGDEITLQMPYATFTYVVEKHEIVDPDEVGIVKNVGYDRLVLTACHPLYSAAQRYAQFAKLTGITLLAAGEGRWEDP